MPQHSGGIIFEFVKKGRYIKVSAVDTSTGIEASIVGDPNAPQERLEDLAMQKLDYVIQKRKNEGSLY